jgi:hypothetical protein
MGASRVARFVTKLVTNLQRYRRVPTITCESTTLRKILKLRDDIAEWRSMIFGVVLLNGILSPLRLPFRHLGTYQRYKPDSSFYCPRSREAYETKERGILPDAPCVRQAGRPQGRRAAI